MPVYPSASLSPMEAHCRRVAALALEIASRLRLPAAELTLLEQAALLHHYPEEVLAPRSLERLLADLRTPAPSEGAAGALTAEVRAVLERFHCVRGRATAGKAGLLAEILEAANYFEERIQYLPFELRTVEQILDEIGWLGRDGVCRPAVAEAAASLPRVRLEELLLRVQRLPVFPAVALKAMELAGREDADTRQIERLVSSDQVLAGKIIAAANASIYSPSRRIASLSQAVAYIGLEAARRVLTAAVFQPLFASSGLHALWKHSLETAQLAAGAAERCGQAPAAEAFLAGLVHDIGRLALEKLPREDGMAYARLRERGCDAVFAELALCGYDHGEAGAEILRLWSFPVPMVEAVQQHHWPERTESALAALLYLAEAGTGSGEDAPSWLRLRAAEERLGMTLEQAGEPEVGLLASLA